MFTAAVAVVVTLAVGVMVGSARRFVRRVVAHFVAELNKKDDE